jgi:hypothetical protein
VSDFGNRKSPENGYEASTVCGAFDLLDLCRMRLGEPYLPAPVLGPCRCAALKSRFFINPPVGDFV